MKRQNHEEVYTSSTRRTPRGKRLLSWLLSMVMVLSLLPEMAIHVHAAYEDGMECPGCGEYHWDENCCGNCGACTRECDDDCYEETHCINDCGACRADGNFACDCGYCYDCARELEPDKHCDYCGEEYGAPAPNNHADLKHFPAKAATKTAEGNIEYWYCSGCGKYFKDAAATKEIAKADTVIAKLPDDSEPPHTGDNSHRALWMALLFVSGGLLTVTVIKGVETEQKRGKRHE